MTLLTATSPNTVALMLCALPAGAVATLAIVAVSPRVVRARRRSVRARTVIGYGRVTVHPSKITPDMQVPALDGIAHHGDFECGHVAWTLFQRAVATGALAPPPGVRIVCYPDRDIEGGGFVLLAFPDGVTATWGVSTGYHQACEVGRGDGLDTSDPETVLRALEVFARELNKSLAGLETVSSARAGGPPELVTGDARAWR